MTTMCNNTHADSHISSLSQGHWKATEKGKIILVCTWKSLLQGKIHIYDSWEKAVCMGQYQTS